MATYRSGNRHDIDRILALLCQVFAELRELAPTGASPTGEEYDKQGFSFEHLSQTGRRV